jgi:tetratricopeptide (TPR) repeat protein
LAALRREPGVDVLTLSGLDDVGVIAFMEAAAGHELPDDGIALAHALQRETDGNPFFVGEILYVGSFASVLGSHDKAVAYFDRATDLNQRGQMNFAAARTALARGRMLARRNRPGDLARAREELERTAQLAAANGYAAVAHRARRELSQLS